MQDNITVCQECIFAKYKDGTQTGCTRDRIRKYARAGAEVVRAYNEDGEFFLIKDRMCPFYRTSRWLERLPQGFSQEDMLELETTLSFHAIVFARECSTPKIQKTVSSLMEQDTKPVQITIVRPKHSNIPPRKMTNIFTDLPIRWRVESLMELDMPDEKAIHMVQKVIDSQYYFTIDADQEIPVDFLYKINNAIIHELLQFGMIKFNDVRVIPRGVHEYWYFHGDVTKSIPENLEDYQCRNPREPVVFQWPNLKKHYCPKC